MMDALGKKLRAYAEKDGRGYPDWAVRYVPIVRRLRHRTPRANRILEVGANENGFSRFAGVPVIALDISAAHLAEARRTQQVAPVVGDLAALPFRDDAFDLCLCVETFEHIPESSRPDSVSEIARILSTDGAAVVTFPSGQNAVEAERVIRERYFRATGNRLKWLEEHDDEGLPSPELVEEGFRDALGSSHRISASKNCNLMVWKWMWLVLLCGWPGRGNALFQAVLRLKTPILCRAHFGRCYRTMIWIEPRNTKR